MRAGGGALFQKLVDLPGCHFPALKLAAEELVGVPEAFEEGGKKRSEGAGIGKEEVIKLLDVHEVEAGGFQGAGRGGAGLVIE